MSSPLQWRSPPNQMRQLQLSPLTASGIPMRLPIPPRYTKICTCTQSHSTPVLQTKAVPTGDVLPVRMTIRPDDVAVAAPLTIFTEPAGPAPPPATRFTDPPLACPLPARAFQSPAMVPDVSVCPAVMSTTAPLTAALVPTVTEILPVVPTQTQSSHDANQ